MIIQAFNQFPECPGNERDGGDDEAVRIANDANYGRGGSAYTPAAPLTTGSLVCLVASEPVACRSGS